MARKEANRLKRWMSRTDDADKAYEAWEKRFRVAELENYYMGEQWDDSDPENMPYVINRVFPTVEIRKPSLLFGTPEFRVTPRPTHEDDPGSLAPEKATLREDTLNTMVQRRDFRFQPITRRCIHEAHFSFGVVEVGYSAQWIDNPKAGAPQLNEDNSVMRDEGGEPVLEPERIIEEESVYMKRIPSSQFRVSSNAANDLVDCEWCGYFEWHYPADLKKDPRFKDLGMLHEKGREAELSEPVFDEGNYDANQRHAKKKRSMVKLWKIWDNRSKKKLMFLDSGDRILVEEPFVHLPLAPLRFHEVLDEWYPLPPVVNWLSPQDELNETREMQRIHRKRAVRRYGHIPGVEDELAKLEYAGDFSYIQLPNPEAVWPIPDAPLDSAFWAHIPNTRQDFDEISGVTGEQRGVSTADTATQANILDARAQIRESLARSDVGDWLAKIGELILWTVEEFTTLPFWIRTNVDVQGEAAPMEAIQTAILWQQITAEQIGPESRFEVTVQLESLSPVSRENERQDWTQVMSMLANPMIMAVLALSEPLMRKTLNLYGIRNESTIMEIMQIGQFFLMQQFPQGGAGGAGGAGMAQPGSETRTPTNQETESQLVAQLGAMGPQG